MTEKDFICGFSKLTKDHKLDLIASYAPDPVRFKKDLKRFAIEDRDIQKLLDEFSENTISNYYFPYGIAPNFLIDGKMYHVPMVIEESSVVAAASNSAKFWSGHGGFKTEIISTEKVGQVHFSWRGDKKKLQQVMPELKKQLIRNTQDITTNMRQRGGGIKDIVLVDRTADMKDYYQLKATFETVDSMGANFINSCLEEFGSTLQKFVKQDKRFEGDEKDLTVIMAILSNYTPDCLIKASVECSMEELDKLDDDLSAEEFAEKFTQAVEISRIDVHRATTHNKGIFNGIDAVVLATGNDFRAVEACGHTFASRDGKYRGLTKVAVDNDRFSYSLEVPLSLGTVGGLTRLHPLARHSLALLGNPGATELMRIAASVGLANNFGALKSLVTKGIQKGHMKMHLLNILNHFGAELPEKELAKKHFSDKKVSFNAVEHFLKSLRT